MSPLFILLNFILPPSPSPPDNQAIAYIYVETSVIHVNSEDFYEINKRYIEHQYLTKIDENMLYIWIECERGKDCGELYIDEPCCYAAALYALEGRPVIIKGGSSVFFDKMKVKIEPFY